MIQLERNDMLLLPFVRITSTNRSRNNMNGSDDDNYSVASDTAIGGAGSVTIDATAETSISVGGG